MLRLTNGKKERAFKEAGAKYFYMPPSGAYPHEISNTFINTMKANLVKCGWEQVGEHVQAWFGFRALDLPLHSVFGINTADINAGERYEIVPPNTLPLHPGAIPVEYGDGDTPLQVLSKLGVIITHGGFRTDSYGMFWSFKIQANSSFPGVPEMIITCGDNNIFITCFSILGSLAPIGGSDPSLDPGASAYSIGGGWILQSKNYVSPPVVLRFRTSSLDALIDIDIPASDSEGYWPQGVGFNWNGIFPMGIYGYAMVANQYQFILFAPGCTSDHSFMIASSMHPEWEGGMMYISGPTVTGGGTRASGLASIHGGGQGNWYMETTGGFRMGPKVGNFDPEFVVPTCASGDALVDTIHNDIADALMIDLNIHASITEPFLNAVDDRGKYSIQGCFWDSAIINYSQDPITTGLGPQSPDGLSGLSDEDRANQLAKNAAFWTIYPKAEVPLEGELSSDRGIVLFGQPGSLIFAKGMFVAFVGGDDEAQP